MRVSGSFCTKNLAKSVDLKILGQSRQDNIKGYQLCLENMKHLINIALIDGSLAEYILGTFTNSKYFFDPWTTCQQISCVVQLVFSKPFLIVGT